jgi:tRNA pseudouridine synthase 10
MLKLCSKCIDRLGIEGIGVEKVEGKGCLLCNGLLWQINEIADRISNKLGEYEFETFLVGSRLEGSIKALEEYIFEKYGVSEDKSIKHQFNRELGIALAIKLGKKVSFNKPDVTIIYNLETNDFSIQVKPLYIYGRYKKRVRNIPQTRWICSACNGKGCEVCNYTGKKYQTSVEEIIAEPCRRVAKGDNAILHGSGREDVDARMLGNGRPFIVEIQNPRRRNINLKELQEIINREARGKVEVSDLKFAEAKDVEYLKSAGFRKVYRAKVEFDREVSREELEKALDSIRNTVIHQRTPKRVEHRRADLVRKRKTYDIKLLLHKGKIAVIEIEADSGLYIKELVSGDEGRTKPSLSEALNIGARVVKLDVIKVDGGL